MCTLYICMKGCSSYRSYPIDSMDYYSSYLTCSYPRIKIVDKWIVICHSHLIFIYIDIYSVLFHIASPRSNRPVRLTLARKTLSWFFRKLFSSFRSCNSDGTLDAFPAIPRHLCRPELYLDWPVLTILIPLAGRIFAYWKFEWTKLILNVCYK